METSIKILPASLLASSSQKSLVSRLVSRKFLKTPRIIKTMANLDRKLFVGSPYIDTIMENQSEDFSETMLVQSLFDPYYDRPYDIGYSSLMCAPHIHAIILELLSPSLVPGSKVLDIGSGSGYLTVAMASLVHSPNISLEKNALSSVVVAVEHVHHLVRRSQRMMKSCFPQNYHIQWLNLDARPPSMALDTFDTISLQQNYSILKGMGPFDCINVGCSVPIDPVTHSIPRCFLDLMSSNSRMVIPLGFHNTQLLLVTRNDSKITVQSLFSIPMTPITPLENQYFETDSDDITSTSSESMSSISV